MTDPYEDPIEDRHGKPIKIGTRVSDSGGTGTVVAIQSCADRDGHPPTFDVEFDASPDCPERQGTTVRDYRREGPNGPFVYVADEVEVA